MVAPRPAAGGDLGSIRERARSLAAVVTSLEHRLAGLRGQEAGLERRIREASARIGEYELARHRAQRDVARARKAYVRAAVAQYEAPDDSAMLVLMLSAKRMSQVLTLDAAAGAAGERMVRKLKALLDARADVVSAEKSVDARKQALLREKAKADTVAQRVAAKLDSRRQQLRRLMSAVHRLERRARIEARREAAAASGSAASVGQALAGLLAPSGPAPGIPDGFAPTGVSFEGVASWYGPGFEGHPTASGQTFDADLYTAASRDLPLGTWLYVSHAGRGVVVLVNDRGPYVGGRVLDLSRAAAQAIGISGNGWVMAEVLVETGQGASSG
jgi:rare lipoprotein A